MSYVGMDTATAQVTSNAKPPKLVARMDIDVRRDWWALVRGLIFARITGRRFIGLEIYMSDDSRAVYITADQPTVTIRESPLLEGEQMVMTAHPPVTAPVQMTMHAYDGDGSICEQCGREQDHPIHGATTVKSSD